MRIRVSSSFVSKIAFLCAALFPCLVPAAVKTLVVRVPFEFAVGQERFPAGEYVVTTDSPSSDRLRLRSVDGSRATTILAHRTVSGRDRAISSLVFRGHGDGLFLARVEAAASGAGWEIAPSRTADDTVELRADVSVR